MFFSSSQTGWARAARVPFSLTNWGDRPSSILVTGFARVTLGGVLREAILGRLKEIVEQAATSLGLEVMQVEMVGGGKHRLLRITLDKDVEGGVSLDECEKVSHQVSAVLDAEDLIPGEDGYQLEVGSPGIERALVTARDYTRFTGQLAKLVLREPIGKQKTLVGRLAGFADGVVQLTMERETLGVPLDQISKANLKFEWPKG